MKQLGNIVGVSESMIGMIETGERNPSFETLLKLGEALDVPVDMILRGNIYAPLENAGRDDEYVIDLFKLSEEQRNLIRAILKLNPQQLSAFLSLAESLAAAQSNQDD